MDFQEAIDYASKKHSGQYRRQGEDYIVHPLRVVEILKEKGLKDRPMLMAGLFHDLLEDTDASEEEILDLGDREVLDLVKILTKEEAYNMDDYIARIEASNKARLIKLADRISNLEDSIGLKDYDFLLGYLRETEDYFLDLAKGTLLEGELFRAAEDLSSYLDSF